MELTRLLQELGLTPEQHSKLLLTLEIRNNKLTDAIKWALGEKGNFDRPTEDAPPFWWRSELRRKAGL